MEHLFHLLCVTAVLAIAACGTAASPARTAQTLPADDAGVPCPHPEWCGPQPEMPNYVCPDGGGIAGPTGRCLLAPDGGFCGWEIRSCP